MKKSILPSFLVIIVILNLNSSCNSEALNPHTDRFSCKIDGNRWSPIYKSDNVFDNISFDPLRVTYYSITGTLFVSASRKKSSSSKTEYISFTSSIDTTNIIGKHKINISESLSLLRGFECEKYQLDTTQVGEIEIIRMNFGESEIKGEFKFIVNGIEGCQDTKEITNGKLNTLFTFY